METTLSILSALSPYSFRAPLARLTAQRQTYEAWDSDHMPSLEGRVALVTGGNGSLGLETAYNLALHGATVFLGARSELKALQALDIIHSRLTAAQGNHHPKGPKARIGKVHYLHCDMSSIRTARKAARELLRKMRTGMIKDDLLDGEPRLDILIMAAGVASGPFELNEDGIESFMATNVVSQLSLLDHLLPLLRSTSLRLTPDQASCRIIFVSSSTHNFCSIPPPLAVRPTFKSWSEVNDQRRWQGGRYAQSKLAQILLCNYLATILSARASGTSSTSSSSEQGSTNTAREGAPLTRNVDIDGDVGRSNPRLVTLSLHPGEVMTPLVERLIPSIIWLHLSWLITWVLLTVFQGSRTILFSSTSPSIDKEGWNGAYLSHPCSLAPQSHLARDPQMSRDVWRLCMRRVVEVGEELERLEVEEEEAERALRTEEEDGNGRSRGVGEARSEKLNERGEDEDVEWRLSEIYKREVEQAEEGTGNSEIGQ